MEASPSLRALKRSFFLLLKSPLSIPVSLIRGAARWFTTEVHRRAGYPHQHRLELGHIPGRRYGKSAYAGHKRATA